MSVRGRSGRSRGRVGGSGDADDRFRRPAVGKPRRRAPVRDHPRRRRGPEHVGVLAPRRRRDGRGLGRGDAGQSGRDPVGTSGPRRRGVATGRGAGNLLRRRHPAERARHHRSAAVGGRERCRGRVPDADAERGVDHAGARTRRRDPLVVVGGDPAPRSRSGTARTGALRLHRRRARPGRVRERVARGDRAGRASGNGRPETGSPHRRCRSVRVDVHESARRPERRRDRRHRPRHLRSRPHRGRAARVELAAGDDAGRHHRRDPRRRSGRSDHELQSQVRGDVAHPRGCARIARRRTGVGVGTRSAGRSRSVPGQGRIALRAPRSDQSRHRSLQDRSRLRTQLPPAASPGRGRRPGLELS